MAMNKYDVIFIDDEPNMLDIFQQFVNWKFKHWRTCTFIDSQELYDKIVAHEISAVVWIVDIMMPMKNGAEVAEAVNRESKPGTIILGYTALDTHTLETNPAYKNGLKHFSKIINKQENFWNLLELVDTWVKKGGA